MGSVGGGGGREDFCNVDVGSTNWWLPVTRLKHKLSDTLR